MEQPSTSTPVAKYLGFTSQIYITPHAVRWFQLIVYEPKYH